MIHAMVTIPDITNMFRLFTVWGVDENLFAGCICPKGCSLETLVVYSRRIM